jgi:hypothetical protein
LFAADKSHKAPARKSIRLFLLFLSLGLQRLFYRPSVITMFNRGITIEQDRRLVLFYVTHDNCSRVPEMHQYIETHKDLSTRNFDYYFVDYSATDQESPPSLALPDTFREHINHITSQHWSDTIQVSLLIRYFFCATFTLEHTRARWMLRVSDDTVVNFEKLGEFIDSLDARYDALTDFVFKAHCACCWAPVHYPQGGAGFVLSRRGCELALEHALAIAESAYIAEDVAIGRYLVQHGVSDDRWASQHFSGHTVPAEEAGRLRERKFPEMPECASVWERGDWACIHIISPANNLVFFHMQPGSPLSAVFADAELFFRAPPQVFWWNGNFGAARFCVQRNFSQAGEGITAAIQQ